MSESPILKTIAPYAVSFSQRDRIKAFYPREYADLLELVIAGKVVLISDNAGVH